MGSRATGGAITVYWRPGCPYCIRLRRGLRRSGLVVHEVNIWADRDAAGLVRQLAGGNETVPTVVVGGVSLVNPSPADVLGAARDAGLPTPDTPPDAPGRPLRSVLAALPWVIIAALVVSSVALEAAGHGAWSWGADGIALVVYLAVRPRRGRVGREGQS